jgi:hypothetical protein
MQEVHIQGINLEKSGWKQLNHDDKDSMNILNTVFQPEIYEWIFLSLTEFFN